ncbi:hypothetical protein EJ04DRAFT_576229 [Polyplosphaeria fusca]|uniref:Uncharacterized protein n=1 Tax=Polyplosphaeria fusca TaxID=682080 RepID=A0A9P4R1W1_9PLEO|nr:hypothetical protein EJ04DRAFT_576229 [Polyplosphaeria fusca]
MAFYLNPSTQNMEPRGQYQNIELDQYGHQFEPIRYSPPAGHPPDSKNRDSKAHFQSDQPPVPHWPAHSQNVARLTPLRTFIIFFDAILASSPIMFIALALIAARLDGKDTSDYGLRLRETLLLSPTIFPVIFAALMGRFFKHTGLFLAERGTTLGRLEQLVGCQSLFSALERQIALRSWSIIGLLLTLVWLLSPLGGQSALRLFGTEERFETTDSTFNYLDSNSLMDSFCGGASMMNSGRSTYTSLFLAALLSSSRYQATPMDLWGNLKLPAYRSIENASSEDWKPVDYSNNVTYGSLIGIPIARNTSGSSAFKFRAKQWDITCDSNKRVDFDEGEYGSQTSTWKLNVTGTCRDYPCAFSLRSIDSTDNLTIASCEYSLIYLESNASCRGLACQVDSMRKLDLFSDGYITDNNDYVRGTMIANLFGSLPTVDNYAVGSPTARGPTNAEKWMSDPWSFIGVSFTNVDLWRLPASTLASRLSILANTFFQSTYATTSLGGNLPSNLSSLASASADPNLLFNATAARLTSDPTTIYKTSWRWFTALLVSAIILQIAAYAGLVLKYITLAPDIIGYASSLTLLNPYVPTPTGGTTLHGLERAALLHDLRVRIGDVCAGEPVGAIAVARGDAGVVGRLRRGRLYI